MTVQQAIEILEVNAICSPKATKFKGAVEVVKQALEKQIPKKPIKYDDCEQFFIECPCCQKRFDSRLGYKGCPYCLQALDWSDTE